ncbi:Cytochrome P450 [Amphritea atlantica]|uniref:Cytochrome P450 n=1 Tax=Amphritea atlantica TaxID=355243 RepID=A0A1H9K7G5_9GAMM|nr:cytochrome P450 [Amphritea atlantica]SEQ95059.1 Cytochrome P450 [Amphritea atlantica]
MNTPENQALFVPVMAPRPNSFSLSLWNLPAFRRNMLSIWSDKAYQARKMSFRLLNQDYILCNSPDTVRRVFLDRHDIYDKKSPQMRHALEPLLGDGLFVSDGALWQERRKACSPPFESVYLPGFAKIMSGSAVEMADRWAALPDGSTVDVLNEMARLTAQIIGRTVFGDDVPDQDAAKVVSGFTEYQQTINQIDYADTFGLPFLRRLGNPLRRKKAARATAEVHQVIDQIIDRFKRGRKPERLTLLSALLEGDTASSGQGGCPMSAEAARNEAIVMFMAGHETTANALAWTWYLLDGCERSRSKMYAEIDQVLQGRTPTFEDVANLPFTRAVFEESLRLYPPVPLLSRQARSEDEIRGSKVKAGTIMLALPWLLHRHEKEWDNPNAFYPERFMPGNPKPDKFTYIPFSVGHRVCLGLRFGLTEGILCLATLAQRYRLSLPDKHKVDIECRLTLRPKGGLPMILSKRR